MIGSPQDFISAGQGTQRTPSLPLLWLAKMSVSWQPKQGTFCDSQATTKSIVPSSEEKRKSGCSGDLYALQGLILGKRVLHAGSCVSARPTVRATARASRYFAGEPCSRNGCLQLWSHVVCSARVVCSEWMSTWMLGRYHSSIALRRLGERSIGQAG